MKIFVRTLWTRHWPIILYLAAYAILFTIKLSTHPFPFFDWDESIYAQVGREMVTQHTIMPLWQGKVWLDKPPLVPLFYGIIAAATPFLAAEVSTRLATLYLTVVALIFLYILYSRVIKESYLTTLIVIITSLTSIFLQRAQVLNVDVFLLLGWLGYLLFYRRFLTSMLLLSLAVYSKSLIGFYPIGIMGIYFAFEWITKKINRKQFLKEMSRMLMQIAILSLWYVFMFLQFGNNFLYEHFYESHIKRVTSSIESHFGQRTFYIDLLFEAYGRYVFIAILGICVLVLQWIKKTISDKKLLFATYFLPWFIFLNVTKTKIFWYGHPYIGQFAFLMAYPILLLKRSRIIYFTLISVIIMFIFQHYFIQRTVLDDFYSSFDPHHALAMAANDSCTDLAVVVEPEGREASATLERMNLLITTSRWWGNHPSIVYYFHGPVRFIYTLDELRLQEKMGKPGNCIAINKNDPSALRMTTYPFSLHATYDPLLLFVYAP